MTLHKSTERHFPTRNAGPALSEVTLLQRCLDSLTNLKSWLADSGFIVMDRRCRLIVASA